MPSSGLGLKGQVRGQLALVTGASSGIGRAFAKKLGSQGYDLIVVGRRRDRLEELAADLSDVKVQILVADLGEVVCAPGVERAELITSVFLAELAAFGGQAP